MRARGASEEMTIGDGGGGTTQRDYQPNGITARWEGAPPPPGLRATTRAAAWPCACIPTSTSRPAAAVRSDEHPPSKINHNALCDRATGPAGPPAAAQPLSASRGWPDARRRCEAASPPRRSQNRPPCRPLPRHPPRVASASPRCRCSPTHRPVTHRGRRSPIRLLPACPFSSPPWPPPSPPPPLLYSSPFPPAVWPACLPHSPRWLLWAARRRSGAPSPPPAVA